MSQEMTQAQKAAIDDCTPKLVEALEYNVPNLLAHFVNNNVLSLEERKTILNESYDGVTMKILLTMIKYKSRGWSSLINFLKSKAYDKLAEDLETAANKHDNQPIRLLHINTNS